MLEPIYIVAIVVYTLMGLFTFGMKYDLKEDSDTVLIFFIGIPLTLITWPFLLGILISSYMQHMVSK